MADITTILAPYAAHPQNSRGRRFAEPAPQLRSEYQRDRDRIVHSSAFRRLESKTRRARIKQGRRGDTDGY